MSYSVDAKDVAKAIWDEMEKPKPTPEEKPYDVPMGFWTPDATEAYRAGYRSGLARAREIIAREATGQPDPHALR